MILLELLFRILFAIGDAERNPAESSTLAQTQRDNRKLLIRLWLPKILLLLLVVVPVALWLAAKFFGD